MKKISYLLPLLLVFAFCPHTAKAQSGLGFGLGYAYGSGYGYNYNGANSVIRPYTPPYFSIHPPVYYGKRYTRPYGASPFAAWPQLQANSNYAPAIHPTREQIITNPYVPCTGGCACGNCVSSERGRSQPGNLVRQQPVEPLVIENPYYEPSATVQYTTK